MFFSDLADGIMQAKGDQFPRSEAEAMAKEVWAELLELGLDAFPCMVEKADLRFVYQWDETPPVLTVMVWNDIHWQDLARVVVPLSMDE